MSNDLIDTRASQNVRMVAIAMSAIAMKPICFLFPSLDRAYLIPGQWLTARKQMIGRMILKPYIHTCVSMLVESGGSLSFLPQFEQ